MERTGHSSPLVSIVMPAYNAERYIIQAVESILAQTYNNFELLILDDASSDNTFKIISSLSDKRIKIFQNPKNMGYLKSCNFLFLQTKGELITFQDADDWSYSVRIEKQVEKFVESKDLMLCAARSRTELTVDGLTMDSVSDISTDEDIRKYVERVGTLPFTGATLMVRKQIFDTVGPYREFFNRIGSEDVDWAYMIFEKYKCALVNEVLYFYRFNPLSFSKTYSLNIKKRVSHLLAKFLHEQRMLKGKDDLQHGSTRELDLFIEQLEKPYVQDESLMLREDALDSLNKRMYGISFRQIAHAIRNAPVRFANWKVFSIILSRSFVGMPRAAFKKIRKQ